MPGREKLYICSDVDLPQHPRILACEDPGGCLGVWQAMTAYAREHLTDGRVPKRYALGLWGDKRNTVRIRDMITHGLLTETADAYEVVRYAPRNQTKAMVEEDRRKARERMANKRGSSPHVRTNKPGTVDEHPPDVPSSPSVSESPEESRDLAVGDRPVRRAASDGAFGMTVDAWLDGIRSVTEAFMARPVGKPLSSLLESLAGNTPVGAEPVSRARELGREYAQKNPRKTLSALNFADWVGSGRPDNGAPRGLAAAPAGPVSPSRVALAPTIRREAVNE